MLAPLSWLCDFAPFDSTGLSPQALGEVFDDLGMVVEGIARVGAALPGVVVARVVDIQPVAGADRIRRVVVDAGGSAPVQVVCGAWNFDVGDAVALARAGAELPGGVVTRRRMKGVTSDGMLCSERELGLGDDAEGIMVLVPPAAGAAPGSAFTDALGLEPDVVYDLAIETNRPDALCVAGVARDAAARLGLPFSLPSPPPVSSSGSTAGSATVVVDSPDLCPRFSATVLSGVTITDSPAWIARHLRMGGMRPINSVVDASNYVMLELGQPTHPYDLERLGGGGFRIRAARRGERIVTLDGVSRSVGDGGDERDCLICDANDVPVGIAGVMGGASSEIHPGTRRIVLEAANFTPMAIARTSKRVGLRSEASARFERGVDINGIDLAVARFVELVRLTSPGAAVDGGMVDVRAPGADAARTIRVRTTRVNALLGTDLRDEDITRLVTPLGFSVVPVAPGITDVKPPSFRPDATREVDVIEEVARHRGYGNIAPTVPKPPQVGALARYQSERRRVRAVLVGAGVSEASSSPLLGPGDHERAGLSDEPIAATDPLSREESLLRTSLRPGLLRAVRFNLDRRQERVRLFEIGHTFRPSHPVQELPDEREWLAVVLAGVAATGAPEAVSVLRLVCDTLRLASVELVAATADGLHATRCAEVRVDGRPAGYAGEIDPVFGAAWGIEGRVGYFEVEMAVLLEGRRRSEQARPVSRFPSTDIDLAFVTPEGVPASAVRVTLERAGGETLERIQLFDVFRGAGVPEGSRSLAFHLRFCALDRTLTDAEVGRLRDGCVSAVERAHGARLRG